MASDVGLLRAVATGMLARLLAAITLSGTSLVACVSPTHEEAPVLAIDRAGGQLQLQLVRGANDEFGDVTGTLNGADLGAATIVAQTAEFRVPSVEVTDALALSITEDGDVYREVVPTFAAARGVVLGAPLASVRGGDWIEATDGVATDAMRASLAIDDASGRTCLAQFQPEAAAGARLQVPATTGWACAGRRGELVHAVLSIDLMPVAAVETCEGPEGVTCAPVDMAALHYEQAVDVQL